jgi:uncharacterized protein with ACT and thioredoxin-like domain
MAVDQGFDATLRQINDTIENADTEALAEAVRDLARPRSVEDIRWARRMASTRVQEAAARVRVEHGRVVDIFDIADAVEAYIEGEKAGWPGQRGPQ